MRKNAQIIEHTEPTTNIDLSDSLTGDRYRFRGVRSTRRKTTMKKTETKKPLPKFKGRTLDRDELSKVTGGLPPIDGGGCTSGTVSICHIDGTDDGDG